MGAMKLNKLDKQLIKNVKESIKSASGNNWKKNWKSTEGLPINGISGAPFTGKTEFNLFFITNDLNRKGIKGNRWFTFNQVNTNDLWKHEYIYLFKDKDGIITEIKKDPEFKESKDNESHWLKKVGEATSYDKVTINDSEKNFIEKLKALGYKGNLIRQNPLALNETTFFRMTYEDPALHKTKTFAFKTKYGYRDIVFPGEIEKATLILAGLGVNTDTISKRPCGNKLTALYHESQLNPEALAKIKTPIKRKNKALENLDISSVKEIAKAINLKQLVIDDKISLDKAFYNYGDDKVVLPSVTSFKDKEAFFATAFHELTHSTGHINRLNRDLTGGFGSPEYAKEELVAEIGSIFLCNRYGVDSAKQMQNHGEYLKNWLSSLEGDGDKQDRAILKAISLASKSYDYIDNALEPEHEKQVVLNNDELSDKPFSLREVIVDSNKTLEDKIKEESELEMEYQDRELEVSRGF